MNCLHITLSFNIVAGIVQTFKSWNQLLYPRVIEVCRLPFEPRHDFFLYLIVVVELFSSLFGFRNVVETPFLSPVTMESRNSSPSCVFTFALRNRTMERASHLAGLWIGAAISNTPHSNKAGSTTLKRARLTDKGSRSTAVLP